MGQEVKKKKTTKKAQRLKIGNQDYERRKGHEVF